MGSDFLYFLLPRAVQLDRQQARARAIDAVERNLRFRALPVPQQTYVLAASRSTLPCIRQHVMSFLQGASREFPVLVSMALRLTKLGVMRQPTWAQVLPSASA